MENFNTSEIVEENEEAIERSIPIDRLVTILQSKMTSLVSPSKHCNIFKVPEILKRHSRKDFHPYAFSFGPYYHGSETTRGTEKVKMNYFREFVSRSKPEQCMLFELTKAILEVEQSARDCYAEPIDLSAEQFSQILLIDGIFIIEMLCMHHCGTQGDPIFSACYTFGCLSHDLVLLENQIPWVVLKTLYKFVMGSKPCLATLVLQFFSHIFSETPVFMPREERVYDAKHILDLVRLWLIHTSTSLNDMDSKVEWEPLLQRTQFPSATKLKKAGIAFKRRDSPGILDIKFEKGILYIPPLGIHSNTGTIFRNLISYEQCLPSCESYITSYAILFDHLIDTEDDMEILCTDEVIDNFLHREEATQLFNKLCFDTSIKNYRYQKLSLEVESYSNRFWPRNCAVLRLEHFGTPWKILSVIVATIMVVATLIQVITGFRK